MGALSFLTQGSNNTTGSNYTQSSSALPDWYNNYTQQILGAAQQYANQGYQQYQGPRIANQSGLTEDAYNQVASLPGASAGASTTAQNLVSGALKNNNPLGTAQQNGLTSGANQITSAANGPTGLSAASGMLNSASTPSYANVQNYMNPYNQDVTDAIAAAGNRNLTQNTLPALQNAFTGAGNITGGSTEEADLANRAAQNSNIAVSQAQAQALQSGYASSLSAAQGDNSLKANIGSTLGSLGNAAQTNKITAGSDLANIGATAGQLNSQGTNNAITGAGALSNIATQGNTNQLNSINAENTLGQQNQAYGQSNLNLAYQDFLNQQNYPLTQASALQGALSGIQVPTATTGYNYGTQATNSTTSPLSSILGALGASSGSGPTSLTAGG